MCSRPSRWRQVCCATNRLKDLRSGLGPLRLLAFPLARECKRCDPLGEAFFAYNRCRLDNFNPRPRKPRLSSAYLIPEGQPSGGVPLVGMGAAPAAGITSQTREASGHRPGGTTAPVRGARWEDRRGGETRPKMRRGDEPSWHRGPRGSRAAGREARPGVVKSPEAERHGACGRWLNPSAPHPGSTDAAYANRASRRSAAPRLKAAALRCGRGFGVRQRGGPRGTPLPDGRGAGVRGRR